MYEQTLWFNTSTKMSMTTIYRLLEECPKWVQQEVYLFQIQCISMSCSCIRRPNWGICCWRPISQAEKSWKTNPPGWTHGRSKKGKPFAGCNYFLLLSLQRKNIFAAAGERQGGKLGSGVCVGHPRSIIFFFCLAHFPFLLSFFLIFPANQSLISTTNFLTRFPSTA